MREPTQIVPSIDHAAQTLEYRLIDAVTALKTWLAAMRAATDETERRKAADHAMHMLAEIEWLAAHTASTLKRADDTRSEE